MFSSTFCVLPFIHIATDPDGITKPCCISNNRSNQNLGHHDLDQIFNDQYYLDIRKKMHLGQQVAGCETCYIKEQSSQTSHRLLYNQTFLKNPKIFNIVNHSIKNQYRVQDQVYYLDLRFGNLCNLQCRSCSPINSSQLNREILEIQQHNDYIKKHFAIVNQDFNSWYKTPEFQKNFEKSAASLRLLYITGGEPTLIEENYRCLEYLIKHNYAKNIHLKTSTNLTNISKKFIELISQFKVSQIFCSIDGTGPYQEYLRYPSRWSQIKKNFEYLVTHATDSKITLTPVIQNVNFENIPNLCVYAQQFPNVDIMPILLEFPQHLDVQYLPQDYKIQCFDKLNSWYQHSDRITPEFTGIMQQLKSKCFASIDYRDKLTEFRNFTQIFDQHRQVNLAQVNATLAEICQSL